MDDLIEVLITSDSNGSLWTCCAWDHRSLTNLMIYKGGGSASIHGLSLIKNDFILTANTTKPLLHVWPINSQDQVSEIRFVVPGKVSSLAISPEGNYLVAGIQDIIYVWQICSGEMLSSIPKHFQNITTIRFTSDGSHFISCGQDGFVFVWNLTRTVCESNRQLQLQPIYSFKDHGLSVTDIFVGNGGIRSYLCSVSLDRTCRIYDLSTGKLLLNIVFEEPLTCVTMNSKETFVYIGTSTGKIYEFGITKPSRTKECLQKNDGDINVFCGHKKKITCLTLSIDGETLISGSEDENVFLWHINSKQIIRSIPHNGSITNVQLITCKKNLFNLNNKLNLIANTNLSRMIQPFNTSKNNYVIEAVLAKTMNAVPVDDVNLIQSNKNEVFDMKHAIGSDKVQKMENEIDTLRNKNKELYAFSVNCLINNFKQ